MEQHAISSDLIRGHIDTIILNSLLQSDKHAQLIIDFVQEASNGQYTLNQATLYSSLKRLENLGYIKSYWADVADGRRKFFNITNLGKENVSESVSSWAYSKTIIDKLVGSKTVSMPFDAVAFENTSGNIVADKSAVTDTASCKPTLTPISGIITEKNAENSIFNEQKIESKVEENLYSERNNAGLFDDKNDDTNFRSVLNELIKKPVSDDKIVSEKKDDDAFISDNFSNTYITDKSEISDVKDFNEAVDAINVDVLPHSGKIDFNDMILKAVKDGYKIKISSKEPLKTPGTLLINKINLFSMLITLLFALFGVGITALTANNALPLTFKVVLPIVVIAPLIVFALLFFIKPKKTSDRAIESDNILVAGIIVFNVIIVTVALNMILRVDLHNVSNLVSYMLMPIIICALIMVFVISRVILSGKKSFRKYS